MNQSTSNSSAWQLQQSIRQYFDQKSAYSSSTPSSSSSSQFNQSNNGYLIHFGIDSTNSTSKKGKKGQGIQIQCQICGLRKQHEAKGMCKTCYNRTKKQSDKLDITKHRKCLGCNELKWIAARQMCKKCYSQVCKEMKKSNQLTTMWTNGLN